MATYFLTWNPQHYEWEDLAYWVDKVSEKRPVIFNWSCGNTQKIRAGDRLFLLKQGPEPRGIIGSGIAKSEPAPDKNWRKDKSNDAYYIDVKWDALSETPILPISQLSEPPLDRDWRLRRGGVSLVDGLADILEKRWQEALDTHVNKVPDILNFQNISWIKQVGRPDLPDTWAYEDAVEGEPFFLHWPRPNRKNPAKVPVGDIIVIKQRQRLTHLVMPISLEVKDTPEYPRWPFAREVMCLKKLHRENAPKSTDVFPFSLQGGSHGIGIPLKSFLNRTPRITLPVLQKRIWKAFYGSIVSQDVASVFHGEQDNVVQEFPEGRIRTVYRLHTSRERNREVVRLAKEKAKKEGRFFCSVCEFSFIETYGEEYIEAHHIHPIGEREEETYTRVEHLAMVCANCHRMLHRRTDGQWLTIEDLRDRLQGV